MTAEPGADRLAALFRAEFGPPVEERIALTVDPDQMTSSQLWRSVRILRGEIERLTGLLADARQDAAVESSSPTEEKG